MPRRHAYPVLGGRPLSSIRPSDIQAWVKRLGTDDEASGRKALAPATIGVLHSIVSSVMKSAVRDRRIASNPCEGTRLPKLEKRQVVPPSTEQVGVIAAAMPDELRALVAFAAGTGMRQGECFGVTVDRLNMLRREVTVDRQLITLPGRPPHLGPPKTQASVRTIPLPAGTGFHALRHYYASLLIRHGESVKTVQARLGHASAVETLDTYSHLWPDSDDRTREAIDTVLGAPADSLRTEHAH